MSKKKRHHFVSKFYLKGFATDNNNPCLWVYEKGNSCVRKASVNDIALQKEYYAYLKPDGQKDTDRFENYLAEMENLVAPILRKIKTFLKINEREKVLFSWFISLMMTRVPKYRDVKLAKRLDQYFDSEYNIDIEKLINSNEKLKEVSLDKNFVKSVRSKIDLDTIEALSKDLAPVFNSMTWEFLIADCEVKYITSDNPVYFCRPPYEQEPIFTFGLSDKNIEVTFPISKEIALLCTWKKVCQIFREVNNYTVRMINRRTVIAAKRFVFSSGKNEGIRKLVVKYRFNI